MPDVSVVIGIYNGAGSLRQTLASVLGQEGVDLELIAVDDGSLDATAAVLRELAANDRRVRVLQSTGNRGLTQALIAGCRVASGEFIARQDAGGDLSLPGRLQEQHKALRERPQAVMASCGTRYLGPRGELLYEVSQQEAELEQGLARLDVRRFRGPSHHGSTMFRRDAYQTVGGYRAEFRVAQDVDLWLRLCETGRCLALPRIGYQAVWSAGSLSSKYRSAQAKLCALAIEATKRRRRGEDEAPVLEEAGKLNERLLRRRPVTRLDRARTLYFVGSCLRRRNPQAARRYFIEAFQSWPLHGRALFRLIGLGPVRMGDGGR